VLSIKTLIAAVVVIVVDQLTLTVILNMTYVNFISFDRSRTTSYSSVIVSVALSCTVFELS